MKPRTALRLGRVSNLPTVWTNVLAGGALAGALDEGAALLGLAVGLSLFYVAGMYLNDAFDREVDAIERPERPIPAGEVRARTVFVAGYGLLGAGAAGVVAVGAMHQHAIPAAYAAAALAALIVLYDVRHKQTRFAPAVMGLCRAGVYVAVAAALSGAVPRPVILGAAALWAYVVGLTAIAAQETLVRIRNAWPLVLLLAPAGLALAVEPGRKAVWALVAVQVLWIALGLRHLRAGRIGACVVVLIAGICWVDALLVVSHAGPGRPWVALAAVVVAALAVWITRRLQAHVPGT